MSKVNVSGTLIHKSAELAVSDKFRKCEIVLVISSGRYDDYIKFEVINDAIKLLDGVKIMDEVHAEGYLTGRKYTDATGETRYMTNVRLRSISPAGGIHAGNLQSADLDAPF